MHDRNRYQKAHNLEALALIAPQLRQHFKATPAGDLSLDFSNPQAVYLLNKALLLKDYRLDFWDLPDGNLVPAVPGRLDYLHHLADLLGRHDTYTPRRGLDIGTGASLIYPILGVREYGWTFVGSEIDEQSLRAAKAIANFNLSLKGKVEVRQQRQTSAIFQGVIQADEFYDFTMCNPPFYASAKQAAAVSARKWGQLGKSAKQNRSFGGSPQELWTEGGEEAFLRKMIRESKLFAGQVTWFTTLVSKADYLSAATRQLDSLKVDRINVIEMGVGNKMSRLLCWGY